MFPSSVRAVLFDFFGTLAAYQPGRTALEYPLTHELAERLGRPLSYGAFVEEWDLASSELEARSRRTLREFDMTEAAQAFSDRTGVGLTPAQCEQLGRSFVEEWQEHVTPVVGVAAMIERLASSYAIGVVSNTHDPSMVPRMLDAMGLSDVVETVVLSVDLGWCKPHPAIYQAAIDRLDVAPEQVAFVGDSFEADFRGPEAIGMWAYLIDPDGEHAIPQRQRLRTVGEIESALALPEGD